MTAVKQHQRELLVSPKGVKSSLPVDEATRRSLQLNRHAVCRLLSRSSSDDRLLVVVGPCSIHDQNAALEYATRLAEAAKRHHRDLFIAMRVYVEKPRSTVGWKGLIHDPDYAQVSKHSSFPGDGHNLNKGIHASRKIMLDVAKLGLPVATELLNPLLATFLQDVVTLGVIGARTTESQTHREMASDMLMPIGFKNGTDGTLKSAVDAIKSASRPHTVVGINDEGRLDCHFSTGNADTFVILRGGSSGPNFGPEEVQRAEREVLQAGGASRLVVDCSHGNSMKDYRNQGSVASCLSDQIATGAPIAGIMLESNIHEGRQDVPGNGACDALKYGVSITDGCIGWEETDSLLDLLAHAVRQRRSLQSNSTVVSKPIMSDTAPIENENEKVQMTIHTDELVVELV
ncbi:putative phospho-2-dehydro-3-deoxyheptonate aldolase [Xylaria arbuscula]|nr:putative phospho-2-dehydro-3-deoxyheptonate aldolase [Xylaria arbuscula]